MGGKQVFSWEAAFVLGASSVIVVRYIVIFLILRSTEEVSPVVSIISLLFRASWLFRAALYLLYIIESLVSKIIFTRHSATNSILRKYRQSFQLECGLGLPFLAVESFKTKLSHLGNPRLLCIAWCYAIHRISYDGLYKMGEARLSSRLVCLRVYCTLELAS